MAYRSNAFLILDERLALAFLEDIKGTELEFSKVTIKGRFIALDWRDLRGNPFMSDERAEEALRRVIDSYGDYDFVIIGEEEDDCTHYSSGYFVTHPAYKINRYGFVTMRK